MTASRSNTRSMAPVPSRCCSSTGGATRLIRGTISSRRVLGQVLIAPAGPEKLPVPRDAFIPWLDAAPHPERFREILLSFTRLPIRQDLLDVYCRNVALASRA